MKYGVATMPTAWSAIMDLRINILLRIDPTNQEHGQYSCEWCVYEQNRRGGVQFTRCYGIE